MLVTAKSPSMEGLFLKQRVLFVVLLALLVYAICWLVSDAGTLHFYPTFLHDQINYINVARNLSQSGHMILPSRFPGTGTMIFPGMLKTAQSRLYMPGFYLVLAAFIKTFGFSSWALLLPNFLFYLGSSALVCLIGDHLYGKRTALTSSVLFVLLPANPFFSTTVMMELSLVFTALLVFYILIRIPDRVKPYAIPLLILLPFHFRQTAFFLLMPMLAYVLDITRPKNKLKLALGVSLATLLVVMIASQVQASLGQYGMDFRSHVLMGHFNYNDAFGYANTKVTVWGYLIATAKLFLNNLHHFIKMLKHGVVDRHAYMVCLVTQYLNVALVVVAMVDACIRSRKRLLPISFALFPIVIFFTCMVLYTSEIVTLTRVTLFACPFSIIQASSLICRSLKKQRWNQCLVYMRGTLVGCMSILLLNCTLTSAVEMRLGEYFSNKNLTFLNALHADSSKVLVAPEYYLIKYNFEHYPSLASFVPKNDKTLALLNQCYPIGTVVIQKEKLGSSITRAGIANIGLALVAEKRYFGKIYEIYKRRAAASIHEKSV